MILLKEITNANIWKVCALAPFDDQKDFVADNIQSLAEAYATRNEGNNALPLAVYHDGEPIGFVMIAKGTVGNEEESDLIKENYCLWRLMIDKKYQGHGFGKLTIDAVMDLIRTFPFWAAKKYGYLMNPKILTPEISIKSTGLWRMGRCAAMKSLPYTNYKRLISRANDLFCRIIRICNESSLSEDSVLWYIDCD